MVGVSTSIRDKMIATKLMHMDRLMLNWMVLTVALDRRFRYGILEIQQIFSGLYVPPKEMRLAWQKIKVLELLLVLRQMEARKEKHLTEYRAEQVEIIRQIHDQLTGNLQQRFSIESLSKQYLMNPTTLKQLFKAVYGTSIAAHIREHRMAYAARLLRTSDLSIADIAQKVGYDSQSRFSSVFKEKYHMLPKGYRRNRRTMQT